MYGRKNGWWWKAASLMAGAVLVWAVSGCTRQAESSDETEASTEPPRNVRVLEVGRTSLNEYLEVSGQVQAIQATDVSSEEAGVVESIPNDKGAAVREGGVLVQLDRDLLRAELDAAVADRDLASYNEKRTRSLFEENSVSGAEMLQASTALKKAEAAAEGARIRFERAAVKSPFAGIVTERYVEIGQYILPGTPVARVVDPYTLEMRGAVSELDVGRLRQGAHVEVVFDGVDGAADGVVYWVGFEADPATGKFPVEVHIPNKDLRFRPGVVGRARVLKGSHEDVISIPRDAVVMSDRGPTVFVLENGLARRKDVVLGADQGLMVMVKEGLESGEDLIVRGQRDILDGDAVQVQETTREIDGGLQGDPAEVRQSGEATTRTAVEGEGADR